MRLLQHRALPWIFVLVSCLLVLGIKLHQEDLEMPETTVSTAVDWAAPPTPRGEPAGDEVVAAPSTALRLSGAVGLWVWIGAALAWIWRGYDRNGVRTSSTIFALLTLAGWLLWAGSTALM